MITKPNKPVNRLRPTEATRKEPPAYPYYAFNTALKVAAAVHRSGGDRAEVSKKILAHDLEMGESSPSFAQVLASAKVFGMIEGWGSYRLTEQGRKYFLPTNDDDKLQATLVFFASPSAFRFLIERFDGSRLPETKHLANILLSEKTGVPASWSERAATLFKNAADQLGLIDAGGYVRYGAIKHSGKVRHEESQSGDAARVDAARSVAAHESLGLKDAVAVQVSRPDMNVWVFTEGGGTLRLETPEPLPRVLWERLQKYVNAIEPTNPRKDK